MKRYKALRTCVVLLAVQHVLAVDVTTPEELRKAIALAEKHIQITQHLDLTSADTGSQAVWVALQPSQYAKSITVRTGLPRSPTAHAKLVHSERAPLRCCTPLHDPMFERSVHPERRISALRWLCTLPVARLRALREVQSLIRMSRAVSVHRKRRLHRYGSHFFCCCIMLASAGRALRLSTKLPAPPPCATIEIQSLAELHRSAACEDLL